jgi:hypothetical protein
MFHPSRSLITWLLAAWFAVLVGVNDGWHMVPGNGHWVETPSGDGLYVGLRERVRTCEIPSEEGAFDDDGSDPEPWKTEDDCDICRLSGQDKLPRVSLDCPLPHLAAPHVLTIVRPIFWICIPQAFRARAPPPV